MEVSRRYFLWGALFLAIFITNSMTHAKAEVVQKKASEAIPIPQVPRAPNCGASFPGTPEWNNCWDNFRIDMAVFQYRMQEYGVQLSKMIEKNAAKGKPKANVSSISSIGGGGTSNVFTNGYAIQTKGLSILTTTQNGQLQIKFPIPGVEKIEPKVEGRELELRFGTNENARWARIRFPEQVKFSDLKIQRMDDGITVSGPIQNVGISNQIVRQNSNYLVSSPFQNGIAMTSIMGPAQLGQQQNSQMWFF